MNLDHPLISTLALVTAALVVCTVLFVAMKSTAAVTKPSYRLGGAAAAFVIIFPMIWYASSNTAPRNTDPKAQSVPSGFEELVLRDSGLAIAIPKDFKLSSQSSMRSYEGNNNETLWIASSPSVNPQECDRPEKVKGVLHNFAEAAPDTFKSIEFGSAKVSPINGFNSASVEAVLTTKGKSTPIVLRVICDPKLDRMIVLAHSDSTTGAQIMSTFTLKP